MEPPWDIEAYRQHLRKADARLQCAVRDYVKRFNRRFYQEEEIPVGSLINCFLELEESIKLLRKLHLSDKFYRTLAIHFSKLAEEMEEKFEENLEKKAEAESTTSEKELVNIGCCYRASFLCLGEAPKIDPETGRYDLKKGLRRLLGIKD